MLKEDGSLRFRTEAGDAFARSPGQVPLRQWFHAAAVRTGDNRLTVYVNGKPGLTAFSPGSFRVAQTVGGAPSSLYLGAGTGVRSFFTGKIDEFLLFNRALDPEEIAVQAQSTER
jgi:hypothetical protein